MPSRQVRPPRPSRHSRLKSRAHDLSPARAALAGPECPVLKAGFCYTDRSAIKGTSRQAAPQRYALQPMFGEWLSLVEHLVRDQGVGGSNPLSPTINEISDLYEFPSCGEY